MNTRAAILHSYGHRTDWSRPDGAGDSRRPAQRMARAAGGLCGLALLVAGCGDGTTSSGSMAAEAALGIAGGAVLGTAVASKTKHGGDDALPPEIPLTAEDQQAIALAGGHPGPYLYPCSRIFRTSVTSFQGTPTTGANYWRPGGECSLGPHTLDASVELRARKLLHEAGHGLYGSSEADANAYEKRVSRELGI